VEDDNAERIDRSHLDAVLRVTAAFHIVAEQLSGVLEQRMSELLGPSWVTVCHEKLKLRNEFSSNDPYFMLRVLQRWWFDIDPDSDSTVRPDFDLLIVYRNRWAHWEPIDSETADAVISACETLVAALGVPWPNEPLLPPPITPASSQLAGELRHLLPPPPDVESSIWEQASNRFIASVRAERDLTVIRAHILDALDYLAEPSEDVDASNSWVHQTDRKRFVEKSLSGWLARLGDDVYWDVGRFVASLSGMAMAQPGARQPREHALMRAAFSLTLASGEESVRAAIGAARAWNYHMFGLMHRRGYGSLHWLAGLISQASSSAGKNFTPWLASSGDQFRQDFELLGMFLGTSTDERLANFAIEEQLVQSAMENPVGFGEVLFWWTKKVGRVWCRIGPGDVLDAVPPEPPLARLVMGAASTYVRLSEESEPTSWLLVPNSAFEAVRSVVNGS